ncbi:NUDIX domain-containing protein [Vibrio splendidus]
MDIKIESESFIFNARVCCLLKSQDNRSFLVQRKVGEGDDDWALPGGKIKLGESSAQALLREMKEEFDIEINNSKLITISEQTKLLGKPLHQIIFLYEVSDFEGNLKLLEDDIEFIWMQMDEINKAHPRWASSIEDHKKVSYVAEFTV